MTLAPELFGVPLEGGDWPVLRARMADAAGPFWIVTANPEILLAAAEDPAYAAVLRRASWRTVDGIGLALVLRCRGSRATRLPGVDLAEALVAEAARQGWRVALFGGAPGVAAQAAATLCGRYPALAIRAWAGGMVSANGQEDGSTTLARQAMEAWQPQVVLAALGGGPKQERWLAGHVAAWKWAKAVAGVGGAFDMWARRLPRAPGWMRASGLEWLWRLSLEPGRWRRIVRAVLVFPWRAWLG